MIEPEGSSSVIVRTFVGTLTPLAQLFALYVLAHGHYSPGGGFQAGVIVGATYILLALAFGQEALDRRVNEPLCLGLGSAGVLLYLLTGVLGMAFGGAFLDYGTLPLPVSAAAARHYGILLVETGVTVAVAAMLIVIFCRLGDGTPRR